MVFPQQKTWLHLEGYYLRYKHTFHLCFDFSGGRSSKLTSHMLLSYMLFLNTQANELSLACANVMLNSECGITQDLITLVICQSMSIERK